MVTWLFYTPTQIAYAYGWGAINWGAPGTFNHIAVPQALYSEQEDKTQ